MAQVQPAVDAFINEVEELEKGFNKNLNIAIKNLTKASDTELINSLTQLNLFDEIIKSGYGEALNRLDTQYGVLLEKAVREAEKRGVTVLGGAGIQGLEILKDINIDNLLDEANRHSNILTQQLFQNLYAGLPPNKIIENLAGTNLAGHQLAVATYTGIKTFDDTARYKIFEGLDVKWTYFGPIDERNRDSCRNTKENEPEGGYTEKQVLSTETPFGLRGGYNCRHSWEVR